MIARARDLNRTHNANSARCLFSVNETPDLDAARDATFDLVYSARVLQHMPAPLALAYIKSLVAATRPGGHLVVQVPTRPSLHPKGIAVRILPTVVANRLRSMEMHGIPETTVTSLLQNAGCRVLCAVPDHSAGPGWRSMRYFARRLTGAPEPT